MTRRVLWVLVLLAACGGGCGDGNGDDEDCYVVCNNYGVCSKSCN
jgi:hypothetical protein